MFFLYHLRDLNRHPTQAARRILHLRVLSWVGGDKHGALGRSDVEPGSDQTLSMRSGLGSASVAPDPEAGEQLGTRQGDCRLAHAVDPSAGAAGSRGLRSQPVHPSQPSSRASPVCPWPLPAS